MNLIFFRHLFLLVEDEWKQFLSRKRALFALLIYVAFFLLIYLGLLKGRNLLLQLVPQLGFSGSQEMFIFHFLETFTLPESMIYRYPLLQFPILFVIYFMISFFFLPFLIPMVSCDMISEDLSRGTQRFLLFRVSRDVYYISKTVSHFLFYVMIQMSVYIFLCFYRWIFLPDSINWLFIVKELFFTIRLGPVIFVFLTMTQMVSSQVASSIKSLILNQLILIAMVFLLFFFPEISLFYKPLWSGILSFDLSNVINSIAGFSIWSSFFWGVSYYVFKTKKL